MPDEGKFNRYDKNSGTIVVGTEDGKIKTYFRITESKRKFYLPSAYWEEL